MGSTVMHCIDGATVTASSNWIPINGARKVTLFYKRSAHGSGNTVFSAVVAPTAATVAQVAYAKWVDNVANANSEMLTRVASKTLSGNGIGFMSMSPEDIAGFIKVTATETTDGTHDAWLVVQYDE